MKKEMLFVLILGFTFMGSNIQAQDKVLETQKPLYGQQSTVLPDGSILVSGGFDSIQNPSQNAYIYRPNGSTKEGSVPRVLNLLQARSFHTQTLVTTDLGRIYAPKGTVLIIGGMTENGSVSNTAEVFGPVSGRFIQIKETLLVPRKSHTTTEIIDSTSPFHGQFLIVGGEDRSGKTLTTAELFDPLTGKFSQLSSKLNIPRQKHSAIALKDGRILITGGKSPDGILNSGEIFDSVSLS